jgi:hypothetical protein
MLESEKDELSKRVKFCIERDGFCIKNEGIEAKCSLAEKQGLNKVNCPYLNEEKCTYQPKCHDTDYC